MDTLQKKLQNAIKGEVRFDAITRQAYSVDASIYEVEPQGVVTPKSQAELITIMQIAHYHQVPLIARGAATGITGGCLGNGIIVDLSKYLRHIIEINYEQEYAICQPGVIQDELNAQLNARGYRLGPDTSTGNRATIGGMLANNAAGARSLRYGRMVDHVEEVTLALSGGDLIKLNLLTEIELYLKATAPSREGNIYQALLRLRQNYADEIERRFPKIPRRVSGYNLDELIKTKGLNPAKLIAGSEGTLGIAVEIKVKIVKKSKSTALCVMHCHELLPAMHHISDMLAYDLLSLEMIDDKIIAAGRCHPAMQNKLSWLVGSPKAVYIAELEAEAHELIEKLKAFTRDMQKLDFSYACIEITDPIVMSAVWELRKSGLGLLLSKRTYSRAIAFIEDITLAPSKLPSFMKSFLECLKSFGKEAGIYGHVGSGCLHVRPYVDLRKADEQQNMQKMMLAVADLLLEHGGALSGEHGDGYIRSWLNRKMFGDKLYTAFYEIKAAFDPQNLLNPGKVVKAPELLHDLRSLMRTEPRVPATFLNFTREGGLELASDLCNGNGMCRKEEGVMCPSFQVTHDEYDTTRARAQALRAIFHGRWPAEDLASQLLYNVLDLCIQCKGCLTECPSQVDMAKMKSEALYHYYQKHGLPWRAFFFGKIGQINRWMTPLAGLVNKYGHSKLAKKIFSYIGIAPERAIPPLAPEPFSEWFKRRSIPSFKSSNQTKQVVLFSDTFTEFNYPHIGQAAFYVLQRLGYSVIVPPWSCCGRTLYSKGMLREAQKYAINYVDRFIPFAEQSIPIVVLEPSCFSMLVGDLQGLIGENKNFIKIQTHTFSFDAFLHRHLAKENWTLPIKETLASHFLLHGHCHQKAHEGTSLSLELLRSLPNCHADLIHSGCCGMAGAFGYEKEHYKFSMQIGALKLFPSIASSPSSVLVANGTSCRQQIYDGTSRQAFHLAEVMAQRI